MLGRPPGSSIGRRRVTIDHRVLADVTPAMLLDWFSHIGETMSYGGEIIDRYLAWHPIDHIHFAVASRSADGSVGVGSTFHVVEALGADMKNLVDVLLHLVKLDESGATVSGDQTVLTKTYPLDGDASFSVRLISGNVTVTGSDGEEAEVKAVAVRP